MAPIKEAIVANPKEGQVTNLPAMVEKTEDTITVKTENPREDPATLVAEMAEIKRSVVKKVSQSSTSSKDFCSYTRTPLFSLVR